jgi:protein-histidine pros-kinase
VRRLPWRLWATLLAALLITLGIASVSEETLRGPWTRVALLAMAGLTLGLLSALTRALLVQAEREQHELQRAEGRERQLEQLVASRTHELDMLSTHLQALSEQEKAALARTLHDELGGLLTAAKMDLSWLSARIEAPSLRERLAQAGGVLDEAMDLKRRVVEELRPSLLEHFGLATALRAHVEAACARAGLVHELQLPQDTSSIPRDTAIALFRIAQAGLDNTLRHALARKVRLRLALEAEGCTLELGDDGCGFDPQGGQMRVANGLMAMRHRVRTLGGELQILSAPGAGTTLKVRLPGTRAR